MHLHTYINIILKLNDVITHEKLGYDVDSGGAGGTGGGERVRLSMEDDHQIWRCYQVEKAYGGFQGLFGFIIWGRPDGTAGDKRF
jgi:hypothetical protein